MCFLLNLLLNTDKNNFLYNKFSKIFRLVSWTIFLRAHKVEIDIANTDIANHKKYIKCTVKHLICIPLRVQK